MIERFLTGTLAFLFFCLVLLEVTINIGTPYLVSSHESRVLETAREMMRRDDPVCPTFLGVPRLKKPPLPYWATWAAFAAAGGTPAVLPARVVVAIHGLLFAVSVAGIAHAIFGRRDVLIAFLVTAGSWLFVVEFRKVSPDPYLASWTTAAVALIANGVRAGTFRKFFVFAALTAVATAFALLSKGPIALFFIAVGGWAVYRRPEGKEPSLTPMLQIATAVGALVVAAIPGIFWLWRIDREVAGGLLVLESEIAKRLADDESGGRSPLTYLPALGLFFAPWTLVLLAAFERRATPLRLRLWFLISLGFLVFLSSRKMAYLLPLVAPAALLITRIVAAFRDGKASPISILAIRLTAAAVAVATLFSCGRLLEHRRWIDLHPRILAVMAVSAAVALFFCRRRPRAFSYWLCVAAVYFLIVHHALFAPLDHDDLQRTHLGRIVGQTAREGPIHILGIGESAAPIIFYADRTPQPIDSEGSLPLDRPSWLLTTRNFSPQTDTFDFIERASTVGKTNGSQFVLYEVRPKN
jgi:4-amino-4-deoxy-L-arabinose transferase-like glycosyltransferase